MKMFRMACLSVSALVLIAGAGLFAEDADAAGSKDHIIFQRYLGSVITQYSFNAKGHYLFPSGALSGEKRGETINLDGKLTRITYNIPSGVSTEAVFEHFKQKAESAGFEILYSASGSELSTSSDWSETFYKDIYSLGGETKSQRFFSCRLSSAQGDIYATLYATQGWYTHAVAQLDVMEIKPVKDDKKAPKRNNIFTQIKNAGKAVVYGIKFEKGSLKLTRDSGKALAEIADAIKQSAGVKFFVVGHTDNSLDYAGSVDISRKKAETVVNALVSDYGINSSVLEAQGVGALCPVSENCTAKGKLINTRIEIVAK